MLLLAVSIYGCVFFIAVYISSMLTPIKLLQAETLAAGAIVGLEGEKEENKDPILTNTVVANPIKDFPDDTMDPDTTETTKSKIGFSQCC